MNILDWNEYKETQKIEEGLMSNLKNWLSRNFSGSVSKIDSYLNSWRAKEREYIKDKDKAESDINQLDLERSAMKKDPALYKANEASVRELKKKILALENLREKNFSLLESKLNKVIKNNKRLSDYYELRKSNMDVEIAKDLLDNYKWDKVKEDEIYTRYSDALEEVRRKEKDFKDIDFKTIIKSLPSLTSAKDSSELMRMSEDEFKKMYTYADKSGKYEIHSKLDDLKTKFSVELSEIKREIIDAKDRIVDRDSLNKLYSEKDEIEERYRKVNSRIKYLNSISHV
jgi:hypothetical protein